MLPELEEFRKQIERLRDHPLIAPQLHKGEVHLSRLDLADVATLSRDGVARYFLLAAANLNRTALKRAIRSSEGAQTVAPRLRKAYVIRARLPVRQSFGEIVNTAVALRQADLTRKSGGGIEGLFRERLRNEGIPILMSPPVRSVPGLLISRRKPDGVYPDPALGLPPQLYLEVKNVRRVADDIQKRLYEIAEASMPDASSASRRTWGMPWTDDQGIPLCILEWGQRLVKALSPVISRPTISDWTVSVPS